MAGLPGAVIDRARQILRDLEGEDGGPLGRQGRLPGSVDQSQLSLFQAPESPVVQRLRSVVPEAMTPLEALVFLSELKRQVEDS